MGPRIAVVGAGGVGGYVAGHMTRKGHDVTIIDQWPEHVEYMKKNGLVLSGVTEAENHTVPVKALHLCEAQSLSKEKPIDIAIVSTKCYDTEWATHLIAPYLSAHGFVVSLQNSTMEECIARVVGWGKTLGCIASMIAVELYKPGHVKRTIALGGSSHIVFRVGEIHGRRTARAEQVASALSAGDSAAVTDNLWGERWSKLVINAMRNGLSAVSGLYGNARDLSPVSRWVSIRLGSEAIRVGQALGFELVSLQGMDPELVARAGEGDRRALAHVVEKLEETAKKRRDDQRPSMAQDIERGRRTETDFINGYIAGKGREIGIAAPLNEKMNALVKRIERNEVKPAASLIEGL